MDKHTFKVGDRVKSVYYVNSRANGVEIGVVGEVGKHGVEVDFDRKEVNREGKDKWYLSYREVQHDTDFQVGDWVRYEGVEDGHVPELEGEVGIVTYAMGFSTVGVKFPAHWNPDALWNKANLVKIQPPQKDSDDTIIHGFTSYTNKEEKKMDIQGKSCPSAKIFGVHETVLDGEHGYAHKGHVTTTFYPSTHWEPVEEWVKIEVRKSQWETINTQIGAFEAWGVDQNYHTVSWRPAK